MATIRWRQMNRPDKGLGSQARHNQHTARSEIVPLDRLNRSPTPTPETGQPQIFAQYRPAAESLNAR